MFHLKIYLVFLMSYVKTSTNLYTIFDVSQIFSVYNISQLNVFLYNYYGQYDCNFF